jgi:ketosteroid isomerase-like protein
MSKHGIFFGHTKLTHIFLLSCMSEAAKNSPLVASVFSWASCGRWDIALAAIRRGDIPVNVQNHIGQTLAHIAALYHDLQALAALKDLGADLSLETFRFRFRPMHYCALARGHPQRTLEALAMLPLQDVNNRLPTGHTPLHFAARSGHVEAVMWLLLQDTSSSTEDLVLTWQRVYDEVDNEIVEVVSCMFENAVAEHKRWSFARAAWVGAVAVGARAMPTAAL